MSITSALFTGVSGLINNGEAMNVIGNNLANVNTIGFKGGRSLFSDMLSANLGANSQVGRGMQIQGVQNLFSQGSFQNSEAVTDVAIQGNSFFALGKPGGNANVATQNTSYLTRAGAFHVDKDRYLVNPDGYQVLDTNGDPIRFFDAGGAAPAAGDFAQVSKIDTNGAISYVDKLGNTYFYNTNSAIGTTTFTANTNRVIAVINPPNPDGLTKAGGTLYKAGVSSGVATTAFSNAANSANIANGSSEKVMSNSLELSNIDMANEFVRMITTQRAYSANSKTITSTDEMMQEVLNLKR